MEETLEVVDGRWTVVGVQPVAVPGSGERPHRSEGDEATGRGLFLRPEEADCSSRVDDVAPPLTGPDDEVDIGVGVSHEFAVDDAQIDG